MRFQGKVAIITGAGTGIGRDMAVAFAREGASVTVAARRKHLLEETAALAREASGREALVVPTDVTQEAQVQRMVDETVQRFGQVDFMVSNAAIPGKDLHTWENTLENWNHVLATNLTSQFLCARACLKHMMARRSGVIITFSSSAAKKPFPRKSHYVVAKEGAIVFTRTLAKEVGPYGIRANCVVPGAIATELLVNYHKRIAGERGVPVEMVVGEAVADTSLKRLVEPREVTQLVLFLCSDEASAITGQAINVCAGATTH